METLRVALRRVAGRWRVSSSAFVSLFKAMRLSGARELHEYEAWSSVAAQFGCLECHRIGEDGHDGPGPNLTHVGAQLDDQQLVRALSNPRARMPSFKHLPHAKLAALLRLLALLR